MEIIQLSQTLSDLPTTALLLLGMFVIWRDNIQNKKRFDKKYDDLFTKYSELNKQLGILQGKATITDDIKEIKVGLSQIIEHLINNKI